MGKRKYCFKCGDPVAIRVHFHTIAEATSLLPNTMKTWSDCCNSCAVDVFRNISIEATAFATDIAIAISSQKEE